MAKRDRYRSLHVHNDGDGKDKHWCGRDIGMYEYSFANWDQALFAIESSAVPIPLCRQCVRRATKILDKLTPKEKK